MWLCSGMLVCSERGEIFVDQSRAVCGERMVCPAAVLRGMVSSSFAAGWAQGHDQLEFCMGNLLISVPPLHISVTIDALSAVGRGCSTEVCCVAQGWARGCAPCRWRCFAGSDRSGEPQLGLAASPGYLPGTRQRTWRQPSGSRRFLSAHDESSQTSSMSAGTSEPPLSQRGVEGSG